MPPRVPQPPCGMSSAIHRDIDDAERAENHRRVDVTHMGDAECLALQIADSSPEDHAAFLVAERTKRREFLRVADQALVVTVSERSSGSVMLKCSIWPSVQTPTAARIASGQQAMAHEHVLEAFLENHVDRLAQAEQVVDRRGAGILRVVLLAFARGPVPVGGAQVGLLVDLAGALIGGDKAEARAASSGLSASRTSRRRRPTCPSRRACSRAKPPYRPSTARRAWPT